MSDRKLLKEFRAHLAEPSRHPYSEKLRDPRWQKKRLEVFNAVGWRCQECHATDQTLTVHHSFYELGKEPWEADGALMLCLCETHHRERQEVEQRIFVGIARRLCALNLRGLRAVEGSETPSVATITRVVPSVHPADVALGTPTAQGTHAPPTQMPLMANDGSF